MDQDRLNRATRAWPVTAVSIIGLGLVVVLLDSTSGWRQIERWTAGLVAASWFAAALLIRGRRPPAILAATVGLAWLAPAIVEPAVLWHRAPLIHLLLAGGSWWPRSRGAQLTIVGTYALVALPDAWAQVEVALALAAIIVIAAMVERGSRGISLLRRRPWHAATVLLALAVATPPALAEAGVGREWATHVLIGYDVALTVVALLVIVSVRPWTGSWATDLAVDVARGSSKSLEVALAPHHGDPEALRREADAAIQAADRLRRQLDDRQAELGRTLADTRGSWRRLTAADAEARRSLLGQIEALTGPRLKSLVDDLTLIATDGQGAVSVCAQRARLHLRQAGEELDALGHGLAPAALADGLLPALRALGAASAVPIRITVSDDGACQRLETGSAATVYLATAEILTNAVKHARATAVTLDVVTRPGRLEVTVADDGVGGIAETGSGLNGVRRRVLDEGGTVTFTSPPGGGTTVRIAMPVPP